MCAASNVQLKPFKEVNANFVLHKINMFPHDINFIILFI